MKPNTTPASATGMIPTAARTVQVAFSRSVVKVVGEDGELGELELFSTDLRA